MLDRNIIPCITKPTQITKSTATLIDNVYLSDQLSKKYDAYILLEDLSDHLPCLVSCSYGSKLCIDDLIIKHRKINDDTISNVKSELDTNDWPALLNDKCTENSFKVFQDVLYDSLASPR